MVLIWPFTRVTPGYIIILQYHDPLGQFIPEPCVMEVVTVFDTDAESPALVITSFMSIPRSMPTVQVVPTLKDVATLISDSS